MKLKITLTTLILTSCNIFFAQETKPATDTIKAFSKTEMAILDGKTVSVNLQGILDNAKERLKVAQKEFVRNAEKHNKGLLSGALSPNKIAEYEKDKILQIERIEKLKVLVVKTIAQQKLQETQKRDAEKVGKEKEKAEKKAKRTLKDAEAKKRKDEERLRKLERERKLLEKKNQRITEIKAELTLTKDKLDEAQKKLAKDDDKYSKDLAKGNLSPNDVSNYQIEKTKQEERIDVLKEKITEIERRLDKVMESK